MKRWVLGLPETVPRRDVLALAAAAAKPSTWRDARAAGEACVCGGTLVERIRRKDARRFLGCSRYPACRRTYPLAPDR